MRIDEKKADPVQNVDERVFDELEKYSILDINMSFRNSGLIFWLKDNLDELKTILECLDYVFEKVEIGLKVNPYCS